ncbi:MAG: hypothetical protein GXO75_14855 [Calditrichaeota bacterium]|nr:hypothetical protein [Calditrichota bacterium]
MDQPSQILFCCQNASTFVDLIGGLAKKYLITLACEFDMLSSLPKECVFSLIMMEIPSKKNELIKAFEDISAGYPSPKIIIFDGNHDQKTLAEAFKRGAVDYFPKPVDYDLLLERTEALMRNT